MIKTEAGEAQCISSTIVNIVEKLLALEEEVAAIRKELENRCTPSS